jgi:hypothetical protein
MQAIAYPYAQNYQAMVAAGTLTDCQGLAAFASTMASISQNSSEMIESFGVLTPMQFASRIGAVASNSQAVFLNTGQASGYAPAYQNSTPDGGYGDPSWNGDQGHHFAAFFQFGYLYGPVAGAAAVDIFEGAEALLNGGPLNQGDVNLGRRPFE